VVCFNVGGSSDTTITLFDVGIPQGHSYKTEIRLLFTAFLCDISGWQSCLPLTTHCFSSQVEYVFLLNHCVNFLRTENQKSLTSCSAYIITPDKPRVYVFICVRPAVNASCMVNSTCSGEALKQSSNSEPIHSLFD